MIHPHWAMVRHVSDSFICLHFSFREPVCLSPDNVTDVAWHVACSNSSTYKGGGRDINRKTFSMAMGVVLILCVSAMLAIFMAVHENMKTRQAVLMQRQGLNDYGDGDHYHGHERTDWADGGHQRRDAENSEYAATAASIAKLSQLPTYEEAVMLSRKPSPRHVKRHSCTQTTDDGVAVATAGRMSGNNVDYDEAAYLDSDEVSDRLLSHRLSPRPPRVTEL